MINPEDLPEFLREEIDEAAELEYELQMHDLDARIGEFAEQLLEAMSTPVDMRFQNWLSFHGVEGNVIPSPLYGELWNSLSEEEKDQYRSADPEATD